MRGTLRRRPSGGWPPSSRWSNCLARRGQLAITAATGRRTYARVLRCGGHADATLTRTDGPLAAAGDLPRPLRDRRPTRAGPPSGAVDPATRVPPGSGEATRRRAREDAGRVPARGPGPDAGDHREPTARGVARRRNHRKGA